MMYPLSFAGDGFDRSAEERDQADVIYTQAEARSIALWRGKPLVEGDRLVRLSVDHEIFEDKGDCIYLGRPEGQPLFATDISKWEPADIEDAALGAFLDDSRQIHPLLPSEQSFIEMRAMLTVLDPFEADVAATAKAVLEWQRSHGYCAKCGHKTEAVKGGWQRSCSACGAQHFPRTDPVVIMMVERNDRVLVGRGATWPEKMYSVLAGFVEPGETIEAAVRREVFEETGITVGEVHYAASQSWPFPSSLMIGCTAVATSDDIRIDPEELADAKWLTREELASVFSGEHPEVAPPRKGPIAGRLLANWLAATDD